MTSKLRVGKWFRGNQVCGSGRQRRHFGWRKQWKRTIFSQPTRRSEASPWGKGWMVPWPPSISCHRDLWIITELFCSVWILFDTIEFFFNWFWQLQSYPSSHASQTEEVQLKISPGMDWSDDAVQSCPDCGSWKIFRPSAFWLASVIHAICIQARVKKIMQTDDEVGKVAASVPILVCILDVEHHNTTC